MAFRFGNCVLTLGLLLNSIGWASGQEGAAPAPPADPAPAAEPDPAPAAEPDPAATAQTGPAAEAFQKVFTPWQKLVGDLAALQVEFTDADQQRQASAGH